MKLSPRPVHVFDISPGGVLVVAHSQAPDNESFDAFLDCCDRHRSRIRGYLILAGAGAPSAAQRARSNARKPHVFPIRTAILSFEAAATNFATAALKMNRPRDEFATFAPRDHEEALDFLLLPAEERPVVIDLLARLAVTVGVRWPVRRTAANQVATSWQPRGRARVP